MCASHWGMTPRQSVERECARRGNAAVVSGCVALLEGRAADPELLVALGGPPARWAVTGGRGGPAYWSRVWGARGLLWAWDDSAHEAALAALTDDAWRVREMAAKVALRHELGDAIPTLADLEARDPVARVRTAARRALAGLTASGA